VSIRTKLDEWQVAEARDEWQAAEAREERDIFEYMSLYSPKKSNSYLTCIQIYACLFP